ncbi:TPA: Cys-rich peptide radical SAM maturase CcpM [Clostridioides difficile]|uniref:Cys-rich peptide radical SAM maturase CcpM n=1 Tax=Clostridioides difficile TaxID=1496 RepID=UPI0010B871C0|nr:Cys-rich peptide radical SAM maturase CcpM [Clostridioides difficile]UUV16469.1 Cys-rich peptide radical SAM maturase CcpM [Clostridioides difficile]VHY39826.1 radical SAM family protein [Clostridioides difficile]
MNREPFIHLFSTSEGKYIYDVNTDQILKVPDEIYTYLEDNKKDKVYDKYAEEYIQNLKNEGLLKSKRVIKTEHPSTEFLPAYLKNNLTQLILQVTQNCNLRCDYCIYSGGYYTRTHSNKKMNFELAKSGIDYLIKHSRNSQKLFLGFYGGEPLLEFNLIKKCIEYIEQEGEGKKIDYVITTNATLINDEILEFFVKNDFKVTISLDGPKNVHDRNRKFVNSDKGSFSVILNKLRNISRKYPEYYKKNIYINAVFTTEDGFSCLSDFFSNNRYIKDLKINADIVSESFSKDKVDITKKFIEEKNFEDFKFYLAKLGRFNKEKVSVLTKNNLALLNQMREYKTSNSRNQLPDKWHHGGPCIPGIQRLFLNVEGEFFPCEKVCETMEFTKLGNIKDGIDLNKAKNILNIENLTSEKCHNCWIYSYCSLCVQKISSIDDNLQNEINKECISMRRNIENIFKDYCVLKECGFDLELDSLKNINERR